MSEAPHSPVNAHLAEIQRLQDEVQELTTSLLAARNERDLLRIEIDRFIAQAAHQSRQVAEQSMYIGNQTRELAAIRDERDRLKAKQPRPAGKGWGRLGAP